MAQVTYRGNLSAKAFPFVSEYFGASVIVQGQDQNFQRQVVSQEDLDKDRGIPQLYYCHNVMPAAEGFQSIGYKSRVKDTKLGFKSVQILRDTDGNEVFFSHTDDGSNYILPFGGTAWQQINSINGAVGVRVTTATINGQTYIYFAGIGCYMYDSYIYSLIPIELTGLDPAAIVGITSSAGYMIAWTDNSIAWSSTIEHEVATDPIDFVPSLETGAGGGNVEAARGKITFCIPHYLGFIIYTVDNAVAAVYSGNARFPFNLREIVNSGGLTDDSLISTDAGSGNHYAYTNSGLQLVSISQTQTIYPEITDFVSGEYFEDFDEVALQLTSQILVAPMKKAINVIADRYLVVSYGVTELTHAIVFDSIQKRFGKLKFTHVASFEWKQLGLNTELPRESLGFLSANGSISTVDFSHSAQNSNGIMLLGKYQLMRSRTLQLQEVDIESIRDITKFRLYNLVSYDGKVRQPPVLGFLGGDYGTSKKYNFHQTGVNHSLLATGSFYLTSLVLKFNVHGRR